MSQVQSADFQYLVGPISLPAAETYVASSVASAVESPTVKCSIKILIVLNPGTGTTIVALRIYRGAVPSGSPIGTGLSITGGFTPGSYSEFTCFASDALTNAGQAQYCFTLQQTGASANGSISQGFIETMVLSG